MNTAAEASGGQSLQISSEHSQTISASSYSIGGTGTGNILRRRGKKKKNTRDYPAVWGMPAEHLTLKKRTLRVYDGPVLSMKEGTLFDTAFEVRMQLGDGKSHVTSLDVNTVNRAEAVHQYMAGVQGAKVGGGSGVSRDGGKAIIGQKRGSWAMEEADGGKRINQLLIQ